MTKASTKRGWLRRAIAAATLAALTASLLAGCVRSPERKQSEFGAMCASANTIATRLRSSDNAGPLSAEDILAGPSAYQTSWRLRAASRAGIDLKGEDTEALKRALMRLLDTSREGGVDESLEGLDLVFTVSIGIAELHPTSSERKQVTEAVAKYKAGAGYRLSSDEKPSVYGTFLAAQALNASNAALPDDVIRDLRNRLSRLPAPTIETLDDTIIPTVGSYVASGESDMIPHGIVEVDRWAKIIRGSDASGQTLALAAHLTELAQGLGVPKPSFGSTFNTLQSSAGWAAEPGGDADAQATAYAVTVGLHQKNLHDYLQSGRGATGWLEGLGPAGIESIYAGLRIAELCSEADHIDPKQASRHLRPVIKNGGLSLLDVGRLCYIEQKLSEPLLDREDLAAEISQITDAGVTFDEAVELKIVAHECNLPISDPVVVKSDGSFSAYGAISSTFLDTASGWAGIAGETTPTLRPLPKGYALFTERALIVSEGSAKERARELRRFRCSGVYCPISKSDVGDRSSDSPRLRDQVMALEVSSNVSKNRSLRVVMSS